MNPTRLKLYMFEADHHRLSCNTGTVDVAWHHFAAFGRQAIAAAVAVEKIEHSAEDYNNECSLYSYGWLGPNEHDFWKH